VFGSILASVGVVLLAAGLLLVGLSGHRDRAGYFHTDEGRITSQGYAVTSDAIDLGSDLRPGTWGWDAGDFVELRLRAQATDPNTPLFIGVARTSDVDAYLADVGHDVIDDFDPDPFVIDYRTVRGERPPALPAAQSFWAASTTGTGQQSLEWTPSNGHWTVVVMNADGHRNVEGTMDLGANVKHLGLITGGLLVAGVLIGAGGAVLIVVPVRRSRRPRIVTTF
jgi:hypothetical protein